MLIKLKKFVLGIIVIFFIIVIAYISYMQINYYRIEDNKKLEVKNNTENVLETGKKYTALTYNVGFGAYSDDYSFFMDKAVMKDGTKVQGKNGTGLSEKSVLRNTKGSMYLSQKSNPDFLLLQEVDTDATRSYKINQKKMFENKFSNYSSVFAINFHAKFLLYPFNDPHGYVNAGILTLSKYKTDEAIRRSYPVDNSFITKFTDLDRCFSVSKYSVKENKQLVIINNHMSAYDEGGKIRAKQLKLLNDVIKKEINDGNYVICGGDFNHSICDTLNSFETEQNPPEGLRELKEQDIVKGAKIIRADNVTEVATARNPSLPYTKGLNFRSVIDGFIVSDNIKATAVNVQNNFKYSDHNPVKLTFILK